MNYRSIFLIFLTLIVISTLCIVISKPKMHKVVMIYNSDYIITPDESVKIEEKNIPTVVVEKETSSSKTKTDTTVQKQVSQQPKVNVETKTKTNTAKPVVQKEVKTKVEPKVEKQQTVKVQPQKEVKTTTTKPPVKEVVKVVERPVQKEIKTTTPIQTETPKKTLTVQEEEILWNIWRSNLQNQIMKDVRLPIIPNGIVFKFTFDVDKFGKISNVQTWSTTPSYTPYAVQYIAPVIRSYQGRSILNFPAGSNRTTTKFTGGWRIATNTKYSTPNDYNDTERVVK